MGIEDKEKKPYQPTEEEIEKAKEMSEEVVDNGRINRGSEFSRAEILEGHISVGEGQEVPEDDKFRHQGIRILDALFKSNELSLCESITNFDIQNGKILVPTPEEYSPYNGPIKKGFVGLRREGRLMVREVAPEKALETLDQNEDRMNKAKKILNDAIDRVETAKERIRRQKQQIMDLKEKK